MSRTFLLRFGSSLRCALQVAASPGTNGQGQCGGVCNRPSASIPVIATFRDSAPRPRGPTFPRSSGLRPHGCLRTASCRRTACVRTDSGGARRPTPRFIASARRWRHPGREVLWSSLLRHGSFSRAILTGARTKSPFCTPIGSSAPRGHPHPLFRVVSRDRKQARRSSFATPRIAGKSLPSGTEPAAVAAFAFVQIGR